MSREPGRSRLPTWFEAPVHPPAAQRIRIDTSTGPARLGVAIQRSAASYALPAAALLVVYNTANMLLPSALGQAIDEGIGPVIDGTPWTDALGVFLRWVGIIALLYVVMNISYRFGTRLGWYGGQRAQAELSDRVLDRILDPRGIAGPTPLPGSLLSVATLDVERARFVIYLMSTPVGEVAAIVVAASSLLAIHPALGLGVIIGAPILLIVMGFAAAPSTGAACSNRNAPQTPPLSPPISSPVTASSRVSTVRMPRALGSPGLVERPCAALSLPARRPAPFTE